MTNIDLQYQILGLHPTASAKDIKQAYRHLAKTWHPDRFVDDPILKQQAEAEIKKINQAYEILKTYCEAAIADVERFTMSEVENSSDFYYQKGIKSAELGNYLEAIVEFTQAIRLAPDRLEAYRYRGFIFTKLGYEDKAAADLQTVEALSKNSPSSGDKAENTVNLDSRTEPEPTISHHWKCQRIILTDRDSAASIAISGDNRFLASPNDKNQIKIWQLKQGKAIYLFRLKGHLDQINCLAMSSDGQTLVSGSKDKTIRFWDLRQRQTQKILGGWFSGQAQSITSLAIDGNNQRLVSCSADNNLRIWHLGADKELQNTLSSTPHLTTVAISRNGQFIASGDSAKQLKIIHGETSKLIRSQRVYSGVLALAFSPDSQVIVTLGFDRDITLWDVASGKEIRTLKGHLDRVAAVVFSPDGKTLISGSWDKTIKLWNLATGKVINTLVGHADRVVSVGIAPDGKTIVSGSTDKTIRVWHSD